MIEKFDVIIVGAGMVGLTAARALKDSALSVLVVDKAQAPQAVTGNYQLRVSAVNQASQTAFDKLGVWQHIVEQRVAPYRQMEVWDKNNIGRIQFDAEQVNATHLGHIIENQAIQYALYQAVSEQENVKLLTGVEVTQLNNDDDAVHLMLSTGILYQARLLIGADGANSPIRQLASMALVSNDYDQQAIVATIQTEAPHQQVARQVFTPTGPLAFLPLAESNLCSIVFSQQRDTATELMVMSDSAFANRLAATMDGALGPVSLQSERFSIPLKMRYSRDFIKSRVVLAGDAAHTIHPLAGQGANLGLMDALAISECITEHGVEALSELQATMRWRKSDAVDRIAAMQVFHNGFSNELLPVKLLRGLALNLADTISPLKHAFIEQALGTSGRLPALATR